MTKTLRILKLVFSQPNYVCLAILVSLIILLISVWFPSWGLIKFLITTDILSFSVKLKTLIGTLGLIKINFSVIQRILVVCLSILSGINVSLFVFYFKRRIALQRILGLGLFGIVFGLLGVGCSSCGSVVLASIIGLSATASFIGILPFDGLELGILGLIVIIFSTHLIINKIQNPLVCEIKKYDKKIDH